MIYKIFSNLFLGIKGIFLNAFLTPKTKLTLMLDYIKFTFFLIPVIVGKFKIQKVYIRSFHYTVYIYNYLAFFYIFNEIFCKTIYSPIKVRTYMDLGANIGLTILWYKYFNPDMDVVAFEPDKYNYQLILKNIAVNNLTRITVHNVALCEMKGSMPFHTITDPIQNLGSGLTLNHNFPYEKHLVNTDMLSNYIKKPIDLIKMDIEGAEYQVFQDILTSGAIRKIRHIIFEMHYFKKSQKIKMTQIIHKLQTMGSITRLKNSGATTIFHYTSRNA